MGNNRYKLTNNTKEVDGHILYRIEALEDICGVGFSVEKGDLGGFIEKETNLDFSEGITAWVGEEACVFGDSLIKGNSYVGGSATIFNSTVDNATVVGEAVIINSTIKTEDSNTHISDWVYIEDCDLIVDSQLEGRGYFENCKEIKECRFSDNSQVENCNLVSSSEFCGDTFLKNCEEIENCNCSGKSYLQNCGVIKECEFVGEITDIVNYKNILNVCNKQCLIVDNIGEKAELLDCDFGGNVRISNSTLDNCHIHTSSFVNCFLEDCTVISSSLKNCKDIVNCEFSDAIVENTCDLEDKNISGAIFDIEFSGWKIKEWRFSSLIEAEEKKKEMLVWVETHSHKYQFKDVFVANAWAVEYRLLKQA